MVMIPPTLKDAQVASPYGFTGGLDLVSAALAVPGGRIISGLNYEPTGAGYARLTGYERTDGRLPSDMSYWVLPFTDGTGEIRAGDTVVGGTSGASGHVIAEAQDLIGSWGAGTAAGNLVLTDVVGDFVAGESLEVYGIAKATTDGTAEENQPATADLEAEWLASAQHYRRVRIQQPPGSGPVRGGFIFNGEVYAVRDDAAGTRGVIHKASSSGWIAQTFGRKLKFHHGIVLIAEGATITGATSGATATVERVVTKTGGWDSTLAAADQAQGNLILSGQVGVFTAGESIKVDGTASATAVAASSEITLPAGGRYAFKVKNFYGATNLKRVYGVNGVGTGFEYDGGSVLVPIETGTPTDTPERIFDIANHLGFTFPGGSIQVSDPGEPCVFNAILGALEIGMGDDVTDVISAADSAVMFFGVDKVCTLTGRGVEDFVFSQITDEAGALPWTAQRIGRIAYLDRRGMRDAAATAAFGNFKTGSLSEIFDPYLRTKQREGRSPVGSLRVKGLTQYRLFYDDGSGFTMFMGAKNPEMIPFDLGIEPYATFSGEMADGSEGLFVGANDGFVYRLDSGTSFDGEPVNAFIVTPFNHLGAVGLEKKTYSASIEMDAAPTTQIGVLAQYDYADGFQPESGRHDFAVAGGGGVWGVSSYGSFYWSSAYQGVAEADIAGAGRNVSLVIIARPGVTEPPHTLRSYTIKWGARGKVKRTAQ